MQNKTLSLILAVSACITAGYAAPKIASNMTYLRARPVTSHNMMLNHDLAPQSPHTHRNGTNISATYVYRHSYNATDLARYFGGGQQMNGDQDGTLKGVRLTADSSKARNDSFDVHHIDYSPSEEKTFVATLNPERSEYGVHLAFSQELSDTSTLHISLPIIRTDANLNAAFTYANIRDGADYSQEAERHLHGGDRDLENSERKEPLRFAHMSNTPQSTAHIADCEVSVLYKAQETQSSIVFASVTATLPTGNKGRSKELFEPQTGNGGHAAFGAGLFCESFATQIEAADLFYSCGIQARYFFEASQKRTLGLYNHRYERLATGGHYRMLTRAYSRNTPEPAANHLTREVLVTPGGQIDLIGSIKYVHNRVTAMASYNLYLRSKEEVKLVPSARWINDEFGQLQDEGVTGNSVDISSSQVVIGNDLYTFDGPIQAEGDTKATTATNGKALDTRNTLQYYISRIPCTSPADISQKFGGSLSYELPGEYSSSRLTFGGEYEWSVNKANTGIRSWALWGKLSVSF